jgi:hypothetical protein
VHDFCLTESVAGMLRNTQSCRYLHHRQHTGTLRVYRLGQGLPIGVISKLSDRATFPDLVLRLKQGEEDTDAGFLSGELLHNLHPPLDLLETPFNGLAWRMLSLPEGVSLPFDLLNQIVFHNAPNCSKPVFPTDLLSLFIGAPVIRDAYLVDSTPKFRYLGCYFRLKSETILLNCYLL